MRRKLFSMRYLLTLNGQEYPVRSSEELHAYLEAVRQHDYAELWLNQVDGAALCVLVNRDKAWLMFLRDEDDAGFSSRNPSYTGSSDATLEFFLSNGQRDEYPADWCIPTEKALQAVRYLFEHGERPYWIQWHED